MTPAEVEATACQTPLVDLLRAIPADAILRWDDGPYSSHSAPVGKYAREAADALAAQALELERMRKALAELYAAFCTPMKRRAMGGHDLDQQEAMLAARSLLDKPFQPDGGKP